MEALPRIALGLAIGTTGGAVFYLLNLPLPWMLGALFATMAASVAKAPILGPARLRPAVVAVIGVLLGSSFTPEIIAQAGAWIGTIAILMVHVVAVAFVALHHVIRIFFVIELAPLAFQLLRPRRPHRNP